MDIKETIKDLNDRVQKHARRLPPGLRLVFGILLICGGILGFLPILGFWMIPLGISVAALDAVPIYRRLRYGKEKARELSAREDQEQRDQD